MDCKPGPVPARSCPRVGEDHSSRRRIAATLEHSTRTLWPAGRTQQAHRAGHPRQRPYSSLLREGLAPPPVTRLSRVGSYPTISPLPVPPPRRPLVASASPAIGGVVSVALSLGSPRVAVSDLPALWSPDFPPARGARVSPALPAGDPPSTSGTPNLPGTRDLGQCPGVLRAIVPPPGAQRSLRI